MTARRRSSIYADQFVHTNPIPVACRVGDLVCSGVITGREPGTGRVAPTLDEQTAQVFGNLRSVVAASGVTLDDIVRITVWLQDRDDRDSLNREWVAMFPDPLDRPARQVHAEDLGGGVLVQCDFIAVAGGSSTR